MKVDVNVKPLLCLNFSCDWIYFFHAQSWENIRYLTKFPLGCSWMKFWQCLKYENLRSTQAYQTVGCRKYMLRLYQIAFLIYNHSLFILALCLFLIFASNISFVLESSWRTLQLSRKCWLPIYIIPIFEFIGNMLIWNYILHCNSISFLNWHI